MFFFLKIWTRRFFCFLNTTDILHEFLSEVVERGVTLLVVEHDMPFVNKLCDTVTVMNFGSVIYDGPVSAMRKDKDVLEAYLGTDE